MSEFVYSRTANELYGDEMFHDTITDRRYDQYIFLSSTVYDKYDDNMAQNMDIYTARNQRTLGNTEAGYAAVKLQYDRQKKIKYANCQTQAIYLGWHLHEKNIDYIILQTRIPNHAFLVVKGDIYWTIVDPWAGRFQRIFPASYIDSSLEIRSAIHDSKNRQENLNLMLKSISEYYPFLMNYTDYVTAVPAPLRITERDYYLGLYLADYAPDIFSETGLYAHEVTPNAKTYQ